MYCHFAVFCRDPGTLGTSQAVLFLSSSRNPVSWLPNCSKVKSPVFTNTCASGPPSRCCAATSLNVRYVYET
ncbi:MAG: hypothetical protein L6Q97_14450, partial [Thermoanaerobaculia bacterium]|nr:hypothetical protein [Thermoanaerobaculia bacterium]